MHLFNFIVPALLALVLVDGRNVYYNFNINYFCGAPDGVTVCHILGINGQSPAPTIEAWVGDVLHITVHNHIQNQENLTQTTLHWHGILQQGTPYQDGPDMVTQCPIPFNNSQTYVFPLLQAGTYWYHSHVKWQYTEGLWGPLIIHSHLDPYALHYDAEFTIALSDWYHTSGRTNADWFLSPAADGSEPIPFSGLLNGRGAFPCNATSLPCDPSLQSPPIFEVVKGKRYRIRLINSSAFTKYFFSIQGHTLQVIEVDGVTTVQVPFDRIPIAPAQRYSVIVTMNGVPGKDYHIWAQMDLSMFGMDSPNINPSPSDLISNVEGVLRYQGTPKVPLDNSLPGEITQDDEEFRRQQLLQPFDRILAPLVSTRQIVLEVDNISDDEGVNHLTFNNITYTTGKVPLLALAKAGLPIPPSANSFTVRYSQVVDVVINNHDTGPHPFHLHGHTFFVMDYGLTNAGDYNASRDAGSLIRNGVRRDTVVVQTASWVLMRFVADNPGVWFLHCHIDWHLLSGLAATIIEAPEILRLGYPIPLETRRICSAGGTSLP